MWYTVLTILHVVVCTFLILVVLLQAGKGGGMGIAFGGSGGSQTVFGSSGAGNFLTRLTAICATIFFVNSLALAYLSSQSDSKRLQQIGEAKAAEKKVQDSKQEQIAKELEKVRAAATTGGTTGTATAPSTDEAAPTPAPAKETEAAKSEHPEPAPAPTPPK